MLPDSNASGYALARVPLMDSDTTRDQSFCIACCLPSLGVRVVWLLLVAFVFCVASVHVCWGGRSFRSLPKELPQDMQAHTLADKECVSNFPNTIFYVHPVA